MLEQSSTRECLRQDHKCSASPAAGERFNTVQLGHLQPPKPQELIPIETNEIKQEPGQDRKCSATPIFSLVSGITPLNWVICSHLSCENKSQPDSSQLVPEPVPST